RPNNFIHEIRIIRWIHADRIAHLKAQSPPREIELKMACVLFRFRSAQSTVDQHCGRERVRPRIRRGGNSEASFSHSRAQFVAAIRSSRKSSPVIPDREHWANFKRSSRNLSIGGLLSIFPWPVR